MGNQGFIFLHRKILDNPRLQNDNDYFIVWVKLLLLVTHQEKPILFKGKSIMLKPGQILTGRKFLANFCNVNRSKLERILKWLENEHQIEQQTSNKNRIITIKNWPKYQQVSNKMNNNRATSEQQVSTYNNVNNDNNDNKYILAEKQQVKKEVKKYERKPPDKQTQLHRICYHLEDMIHCNIVNWGKQAKALDMMLKAGYTEPQICRTIDFMATKDDFFTGKGFDLMTVANQISRYKAQSEAAKQYG